MSNPPGPPERRDLAGLAVLLLDSRDGGARGGVGAAQHGVLRRASGSPRPGPVRRAGGRVRPSGRARAARSAARHAAGRRPGPPALRLGRPVRRSGPPARRPGLGRVRHLRARSPGSSGRSRAPGREPFCPRRSCSPASAGSAGLAVGVWAAGLTASLMLATPAVLIATPGPDADARRVAGDPAPVLVAGRRRARRRGPARPAAAAACGRRRACRPPRAPSACCCCCRSRPPRASPSWPSSRPTTGRRAPSSSWPDVPSRGCSASPWSARAAPSPAARSGTPSSWSPTGLLTMPVTGPLAGLLGGRSVPIGPFAAGAGCAALAVHHRDRVPAGRGAGRGALRLRPRHRRDPGVPRVPVRGSRRRPRGSCPAPSARSARASAWPWAPRCGPPGSGPACSA